MRVIGFDPGINVTGFGILDYSKRNAKAHGYGVIRPPQNKPLQDRLHYLHEETMKLLTEFQPNVVAVEDTFYHKNFKSALMLGQARGMVLLAAARNEITCTEFAPKKVKQSVVGNGNATKEQVQYMVQNILKLKDTPTPFDSSDALAVGLCYINQQQFVQ
ncbi:MAG TPA: crossover junction endodeoxyribonuclease RuvC [Candidatus Marinimicrobia bacterium]|jgi:crossover junction endodeoxyribonuclease RuvC|nr:crossover junction endodeoxyribonuclease RuvC [Candidatus Neomarinimicrobiota bacterium]MDP6275982.1 crossover junction endodeoxyribonuclease RuvC [Candidatus Neomarinimicrobiota bacterium]MDP7217030.1 crossover junction endodeoxyribonuclease RuvC [Candidatus Neomarinimicrobiota bacterium]MDP7436444.1 crossover junction endodeoxyribonuclease RuvC [Candidatus Neomarinimicrobiota bacterium]MDP7654206.1 crossover junction endodeoxyribonuclease RuvC [Candidatus Neomarinimicrobiota bacterium]|tara:strand:+ start:11317 stop:11796 length:480 start_codon:yes stop_codon:yes gene_type:complete